MHRNLILSLMLVIVIFSGCAKQQKVICGGWDTFGEVVCECSGKYEKPPCPPNTVCDAGNYFCEGTCGACKCYKGSEDAANEIKCDGRQQYFK